MSRRAVQKKELRIVLAGSGHITFLSLVGLLEQFENLTSHHRVCMHAQHKHKAHCKASSSQTLFAKAAVLFLCHLSPSSPSHQITGPCHQAMQSHPILLPALLLLALLLVMLPTPSSSSAWDPHPWPSAPPYVEGWYIRMTGLDTADSVALIFGASLLPPSPPSSLPPCYVAILHGDGTTNTTTVYEGNPPLESIQIRGHYGRNVTKSPDWASPPHFTWRARARPRYPGNNGKPTEQDNDEAIKEEINNLMLSSSSPSSSSLSTSSPLTTMAFIQEGPFLFIHVTLPTARFLAQVEVAPWHYDGLPGPHSWTDIIDAVPLHWYIHTLSSRLVYARLELHQAEGAREGGKVMESRHGLVHLEKNWGKRFPDAWLWVQGVTPAAPSSLGSSLPSTPAHPPSVAFVLSYGQIGPKGNFTHFAHFRDEDLGIAWDFTPLNSVVVEEEVDGCAGKARFVLEGRGVEEEGEGGSGRGGMMRGWGGEEEGGREGGGARKRRRLVLELSKPAGSAACLMGPTGEGFERLCEESFQGEARLVASVLKKGGREGRRW